MAEPDPLPLPEATSNSDTVEAARTMLRNGDLTGAEALLIDLASREEFPKAQVLLSRVQLRLGKKEGALATAKAARARFPRNQGAAIQLGWCLLQLDLMQQAEEFLAVACEDFPDAASIHAMRAEACLANASVAQALQSIESACALDPENDDHKQQRILMLAANGRAAEAVSLLGTFAGSTDRLPATFRKLISHYTKQGCGAQAVTLAGAACAVFPGVTTFHIGLAERLLEKERFQDALDALDRIPPQQLSSLPEQMAASAQHIRSRALRSLGDPHDAIAAHERVLALRPDDEHVLRDLYVLNQKLRRPGEARNYGRRLTGAGSKKLPADLAAALEALNSQDASAHIAPEKEEWAWSLADRKNWDRESWLSRVCWGQNADRLLRAWWLNGQDRIAELDALIDWPAADILPREAKCLGVTTHLGPMAGGVRYMQTRDRPFRGFGFAGADPVVGDAPPMRITAGSASSLRELVQEIQNGTLIGFAPDSPSRQEGAAFAFLGRTVTVSTVVPRLIWKLSAASVWWQPLWRDGRIVLEVERMPDPEKDEPLSEWCQRWVGAYLERLTRVAGGSPENLNLGAGIWAQAAPNKLDGRRGATQTTTTPDWRSRTVTKWA